MVDLGRLEHPLLDQMAAYRELQQELESKYFGRWVVIDDGKLVGSYKTFKAKASPPLDAEGIFICWYPGWASIP